MDYINIASKQASKQAIGPGEFFKGLWTGLMMVSLMVIGSFIYGQTAKAVIASDCSTSDCIYSDLDHTYTEGEWHILSGDFIAAPFTSNGNVTLEVVKVRVRATEGVTVTLNVSLLADNGSGLPGANLGTKSLTLLYNDEFELQSVDFSSLNINLLSGTQYWVELKYASGDATGAWNYLEEQSSFAFNSGDSGYFLVNNNFPVFAVYGTPVESTPEPAMLSLFGLGLIGGAMAYRRKS